MMGTSREATATVDSEAHCAVPRYPILVLRVAVMTNRMIERQVLASVYLWRRRLSSRSGPTRKEAAGSTAPYDG